ncbi:MAG: thiolase family protein [bacterium]|nr:thiolase family protein [Acidimicrobiia bacterium]MCY4648956.1 thiolase family protein [bacterium]
MLGINPVVVVGAARTAIGSYGGSLSGIDAYKLGAVTIKESLSRAGVAPEEVDEVVMGQIGQVGPDAYNARRCALEAGLPTSTTAMNVNRLCSSGLQAIITGAQQVMLGSADIVVAGGDENMSSQPFLDYQARDGWKLGPRKIIDGTLSLVSDPFGNYPMGATAEKVADRYGISREMQDNFAAESQRRAAIAIKNGLFEDDIVGVERPRDNPFLVDEHPRPNTTLETLARLRPVFARGGSVTAGNSSGINDGAASVVMMSEKTAEARGAEPLLRLVAWAVSGIDPEVMGYAPALAVPKVLEKAGLTLEDIDLIELNEAFAAQAVAVIRDAGLDPEKTNIDGGAIALGHPVGATGAILTIKLMRALERIDGRRGIVTMCIGGGQGMAAIFERP